ncbi:MAG: HDOD domain-containing protein [bacterium]|nr:HDOD domain-containing protein [bacterium]
MKSREEIAETLRGIKNLPTLPDVATKVLQLSEDPDVSQKDIADAVECDPAIATRLLKLVNSPYFGIRGTVTSIQQSLVFLGVSNLRNLVLSTSVMDLFSQDGEVGSYARRGLWVHSMATALTARELSRKMRVSDSEVAFTAGLIHDVGKVVLDKYFHEEFKRIVELMDAHNASMMDAETAVLGMNHAEVGLYMAHMWSLPEVLVDAVGCHHAPRSARKDPQLAALIGYADHVVRMLQLGNGGGEAPELDDQFQAALPLPDGALEQFCEEAGESLEEQVNSLVGL